MKPGLYMPNFFEKQVYNNLFSIPFEKNDNGQFFVSIDFFRDLYSRNRGNKIFNNVVVELVLRGGKFVISGKSALFPEINILNMKKVIFVNNHTPSNAHEKLDFNILNITHIKKSFGIDSNKFYAFLPIEGFKVFGLNDSDIIILETEFKNKGFEVIDLNNLVSFNLESKINKQKDDCIKKNTNNSEKITNYDDFDVKNKNDVSFYKQDKIEKKINKTVADENMSYENLAIEKYNTENIDKNNKTIIYDVKEKMNQKGLNKFINTLKNKLGFLENVTNKKKNLIKVNNEFNNSDINSQPKFSTPEKNNGDLIPNKHLNFNENNSDNLNFCNIINSKQIDELKSIIGNIIYVDEFISYFGDNFRNINCSTTEFLENNVKNIIGEEYIVDKELIYKKNITDEDVILFVMKKYFKNKVLDLSSYRNYFNFMVIAKSIKKNIFNDISSKNPNILQIESILNKASDEIIKISDRKYKFNSKNENLNLYQINDLDSICTTKDKAYIQDEIYISDELIKSCKSMIENITEIKNIINFLDSNNIKSEINITNYLKNNLNKILGNRYTINDKYIYKKDIHDYEVANFVLKKHFSDKTFDICNEDDFSNFLSNAIQIKEDFLEYSKITKTGSAIKLETLLNTSPINICNMGNGRYKYCLDDKNEQPDSKETILSARSLETKNTPEDVLKETVDKSITNEEHSKKQILNLLVLLLSEVSNKKEDSLNTVNISTVPVENFKINKQNITNKPIKYDSKINDIDGIQSSLISQLKTLINDITKIENVHKLIESNEYLCENGLVEKYKGEIENLLKDDYIVESKFIYKKNISHESLVLFIMKEYYSEKIFDISDDKDYFSFMVLAKTIKRNIFEFANSNKHRIVKNLEEIFDYNSDKIVRLGDGNYKYRSSGDPPKELIESIYLHLTSRLNKKNFIYQYQMSSLFKKEISDSDQTSSSIYDYLKNMYKDEFEFEENSSLKSLRKIRKKIIYLENQTNTSNIEIKESHRKFDLSYIKQNLSINPRTLDIINNNFNNILNKKKYVLVKELYDSVQFEEGVYEDLRKNNHNISNFHYLLKEIYPSIKGDSKILYNASSNLNTFKILIKEAGKKDKYSEVDLYNAAKNLGYSEAWIKNNLEKYVDKKCLVPIDGVYYILPDNFPISKEDTNNLSSFLEDNFNDIGYLSLYKENHKLIKLPKVNGITWNITIANYIAEKYLGYRKLNIPYLKNLNDPHILVKNHSKLNYKTIIFSEMKNFDGCIIEDNIVIFLKDKGLLTRDTNSLTSYFFDSKIFSKDDIGRLTFEKGDDITENDIKRISKRSN